MPSDPRVRLAVSVDRTAASLAGVVEAFSRVRELAAFLTLPTAEEWVAGMPRIHYADHLTVREEGDDA